MDEETYIACVKAVENHDARVNKMRDASSSLAKEFGDDFGGLGLDPSAPLRDAFVNLLQMSAGDNGAVTTYYLDECRYMDGGGSIEWKDGTRINIFSPASAWGAIKKYQHTDQEAGDDG